MASLLSRNQNRGEKISLLIITFFINVWVLFSRSSKHFVSTLQKALFCQHAMRAVWNQSSAITGLYIKVKPRWNQCGKTQHNDSVGHSGILHIPSTGCHDSRGIGGGHMDICQTSLSKPETLKTQSVSLTSRCFISVTESTAAAAAAVWLQSGMHAHAHTHTRSHTDAVTTLLEYLTC